MREHGWSPQSGYFFAKQLDLFKREADQALALAPYDAELQATLGCMFSSMGDRQRGVALVTKANALNPDAAVGWYHSTIYTADYLNGDYRHALEVTRQNRELTRSSRISNTPRFTASLE